MGKGLDHGVEPPCIKLSFGNCPKWIHLFVWCTMTKWSWILDPKGMHPNHQVTDSWSWWSKPVMKRRVGGKDETIVCHDYRNLLGHKVSKRKKLIMLTLAAELQICLMLFKCSKTSDQRLDSQIPIRCCHIVVVTRFTIIKIIMNQLLLSSCHKRPERWLLTPERKIILFLLWCRTQLQYLQRYS